VPPRGRIIITKHLLLFPRVFTSGKEADMTELEKERYISYMTLKDELTAFSGHGAELYLDGRRSDAGKIAAACVFQEDTDYMRDYVRDASGRLVKVNFDRVRNI
jgi:hypothetical protein